MADAMEPQFWQEMLHACEADSLKKAHRPASAPQKVNSMQELMASLGIVVQQ
jgi:hypothetical protein